MRALLFVLPAALLATSTAFAGDSWTRIDAKQEATVYEEVSDNVFMPKGLFESLPDGDTLLDLIEDNVAEAIHEERGPWAGTGDFAMPSTVVGSPAPPTIRCTTTYTVIPINTPFGLSIQTVATTVCTPV